MRKKQHNQLVVSILLIVLLSIGIGYALLSTNLSITGTTSVASNAWNIHFANLSVTSGSVTASTPATIDQADVTKVTFGATLNKPGDFYEFEVDIVNDGTIDGMISGIDTQINNQPISNLPSFINYSLTYSNNYPLAVNHILRVNTSQRIKVRVEFNKDINNNELINEDTLANFSMEINYIQADNNAIMGNDEVFHTSFNPGTTNGELLSSDLTYYFTPEEAMAEINKPFYIKLLINNNIINGSYLGFNLNNRLYYIQGGGATYNSLENHYNNDSIYYESNKKILKDAFRAENCSETSYTTSSGEYVAYGCELDNIYIIANANGIVEATDFSLYCGSYSDSNSYCGVWY